jgi:hypothetical protein
MCHKIRWDILGWNILRTKHTLNIKTIVAILHNAPSDCKTSMNAAHLLFNILTIFKLLRFTPKAQETDGWCF